MIFIHPVAPYEMCTGQHTRTPECICGPLNRDGAGNNVADLFSRKKADFRQSTPKLDRNLQKKTDPPCCVSKSRFKDKTLIKGELDPSHQKINQKNKYKIGKGAGGTKKH